jgi:hypothetical protein
MVRKRQTRPARRPRPPNASLRSGYLGARISFYDIWPLLTGRDPAAAHPAAPDAASAAAGAAAGPTVTAEVKLALRGDGAGPGLGKGAAGQAADRARWLPACVAALEHPATKTE